jgi:sugar O-acyltransferase (sialic acid O-acetyltransferase NeuD family)
MKLLIYCAGSFGREICDTARRINDSMKRWDEILFVDDDAGLGTRCHGSRLFTLAALLDAVDRAECEAVVANGEPVVREDIGRRLEASDVRLGILIHPNAVISETATLHPGVVVTPFCSVSCSADVGRNVAVNTKAIIGPDVTVGEHCVVSSLVNIGGRCRVGRGSFIGMGAMIKQGISIGAEVIVGMGSVVYEDIPDGVIALGNPARVARRNVERRVFRGAAR